jgi:hypothetical protein
VLLLLEMMLPGVPPDFGSESIGRRCHHAAARNGLRARQG